jgi:type II secretory pathway pseudopilin PulG
MAAPHPTACQDVRAFTLLELLVASTLGALLLLSTAGSMGLFGRQVEALQDEQDASADELLADVRRAVHDAWIAEVPDERHLVLTAPDGARTTYGFGAGLLTVVRPDGSAGIAHDALADVRFSAGTRPRYREGAPLSHECSVWSAALPGNAATQGYVVEPGEALALGFTLASAAPVTGPGVAGVDVQLLDARLTTLALELAALPPAGGSLTLHVFRARGPGDARPEGPSLGHLSIPLSALPVAATTPLQGSGGGKDKLQKTPHGNGYAYGHGRGQGNPGHGDDGHAGNGNGGAGSDGDGQGHGQGNGQGGNGDGGNGHGGSGNQGGNGNQGGGHGGQGGWEVAAAPTRGVPVDLSRLELSLPPGRAYALVLDNTASDAVVLACEPLAQPGLSGVALGTGGAFAAEPVAIARSLSAIARVTTTTVHDVVERVRVQLEDAAGNTSVVTASVAGQHIVDDPWLGAVPGEPAP